MNTELWTKSNKFFETDTARYERKFCIEDVSSDDVLALINLHPSIFSEIYCPRYVNSIYLDSLDFNNYIDNMEGVNERVKVRIRWYGERYGFIQPNLELKRKRAFVVSKKVFPLPMFIMDQNSRVKDIKLALGDIKIPSDIKDYVNSCQYMLLVRYRRKYFKSADGEYRLTLDSEIEFHGLQGMIGEFGSKMIKNGQVILEVKYSPDADSGADVVTNGFPFRLTKNSKYITGFNTLMGII